MQIGNLKRKAARQDLSEALGIKAFPACDALESSSA